MLLFVCAVTAIILGFQHYLTMLGTTVLIPTLVFRSIGGHSVGPSSGARNKEREREAFARKKQCFARASFRFFCLYLVGFGGGVLRSSGKSDCECLRLYTFVFAGRFGSSSTEFAVCVSYQYPGADFTGLKTAGSDGKLFLFPSYYLINRQCSSHRRH